MHRNRAKCKLCNSIIESFHATDLVVCKCGAIQVDGGDALRCAAKNWDNFIRVDDEGNEIIPIIKNEIGINDDEINMYASPKLTKKELIEMLEKMIESYENLPKNALGTSITHYDMLSTLLLFSALFKSE